MTTKTTANPKTKMTDVAPESITGSRSGKVTSRKPRSADSGHTFVKVVGPYQTKSGKFEVTWRCECGKTARPYVRAADDVATARRGHARHAEKALHGETLANGNGG